MHKTLLILMIFLVKVTYIFCGDIESNYYNIPSSRLVNWDNAGLLADTPPVIINNVFVVTDYTGYSTDFEKIEAAINDAKAAGGNSIIFFPNGTYNINSTIILDRSCNNIILQGEHASLTKLNFTVGKNNYCIQINGSNSGSPVNIGHNIPKASYTLNNLPGTFSTDDWIHFYEKNYSVQGGTSNFTNVVGQITQLENHSTMKDQASKSYSTTYGPWIQEILPAMNIGIENLKIYRNDTDKGSGSNISFSRSVNCWIRGIESELTSRHHVEISYSSHIEVSGCYFHRSRNYDNGGYGYGIDLKRSSTNCIIENNIFKRLRHAMLVQAGANSNVFIYNYSRDQYSTNNGISYEDSDLLLHGRYPYANLFEQNWIDGIEADDIHGNNGPYNTYLRNNVKREVYPIFHDTPYLNILGCDLKDHSEIFIAIYNCSNLIDVYGKALDPPSGNPGFFDHMIAHEVNTVENRHNPDIWRLKNESYSKYSTYFNEPDYLLGFTFPSMGPCTMSWTLTQNIPARWRYYNSKKTWISSYLPGYAKVISWGGGVWASLIRIGNRDWKQVNKNKNEVEEFIASTRIELLDGFKTRSEWDFHAYIDPELRGYNLPPAKTNILNNQYISIRMQTKLESDSLKNITSSNEKIKSFSLAQNYPNPFNPETNINYQIPYQCNVIIKIYDILGHEVAILVDSYQNSGRYNITWNGTNSQGISMASGAYIVHINAGNFEKSMRILLMK